MENTRHVYSFYGFSEEERDVLISYEPDWDTFTNLCLTYHIQYLTARAWVRNNEVEHCESDGVTFVERGSFALRAYGVVTRCPVCSRVIWQDRHRRCCRARCNGIYLYRQRSGKRYVHKNMWLIHPQSVMTFGEVVYKRKMQIHRSIAEYEDIVAESRHYLRLIESGKAPPPADDAALRLYAEWLDIDIGSEAYTRFVELAQHEALLFVHKEIQVDIKVRKAGIGFVAELVTRYESRLQGYGATKKLAVSNLEALLKIDVADRLRRGKRVFKLPKGYKEVRIVISDSWKV